jgi:hypothetical protein
MARTYEQASFKLDEFRRAVEPLSDADKLGFIDAIEGGKSQPTPEFQERSDTIRSTLDNMRDQIRGLGTGKLDNFIENYFPHIWSGSRESSRCIRRSQCSRWCEAAAGGLEGVPQRADDPDHR